MQTAYNLLLSHKLEISTQEHVKNIRLQKKNLRDGICPRYGRNLVIRSGKYREFWGCSNYPKCKFKMKIK